MKLKKLQEHDIVITPVIRRPTGSFGGKRMSSHTDKVRPIRASEFVMQLLSFSHHFALKTQLIRPLIRIVNDGFAGIYSVNVDYNQQKVTIWGICNKYDVLETMRTKRKEARFWNPEDNSADDLESRKGTDDVKHLIKSRSLSWRAWKRVFTRSNSF